MVSAISVSLGGLGSAASCCSLAESRCVRAFSTGAKTFSLSALLFTLIRLDRKLFAMFLDEYGNYFAIYLECESAMDLTLNINQKWKSREHH